MTDTHHASLSIYGNPAANHGAMLTLLAGWFAFIFTLAVARIFERPPGSPPLPTIIAMRDRSSAFFPLRHTGTVPALCLEPRLTVPHHCPCLPNGGVCLRPPAHAGRAAGTLRLAGGFARYRGGDNRPRHFVRFAEKPRLRQCNRFIWWHVLGLVDFVAAVGTGVLSSGAFATLYQPTVTSSPVAEIPLVLIPAFFVPLLAITHFAAIFKALKLRQ